MIVVVNYMRNYCYKHFIVYSTECT